MTAPLQRNLICRVDGGRLALERDEHGVTLHPLWVRERSLHPNAVDRHTGQRLTEPLDAPLDLTIVAAAVVESGRSAGIDIEFSDGHLMRLNSNHVGEALGDTDLDVPPEPIAWLGPEVELPVTEYADLGRPETMITTLDSFFRLGFFMLRGAPAVPGALHDIATKFGRISATNFGALFDVRSEPVPIDLAYTPVALTAHTDQPYRRPTPGIQFLHTIVSDAPGGTSTMVDGLAAVNELATADPEAFQVLSELPIEFRYDIGTDVKTARAPMIELHPSGALRQLRYSPRLDFAPAVDPDVLEVYYRGRRWLAEQLNSPSRQTGVRMRAGDVLVVDNHRVLHGRASFDPTRGHRHLQGCYIDHDGPDTAWRLARRRQRIDQRGRSHS